MSPRRRMAADERRASILDAAIGEYGRSGMHATSTERIAELAGVSQPYLFRLFGTKAGLISAAIERQADQVCAAFRRAVADRDDDVSPCHAMAMAYADMIATDVSPLRFQLHAWSAASDSDLHEAGRSSYRRVWETVAELADATEDETRDFMAHGMLLTVLGSLDLMDLFGDPATLAQEMY